MSRILVTGGAGFIGSHLVDELIKRGEDPSNIVVIDDFSTGVNVPPDETGLCKTRIDEFYPPELCRFLSNYGIDRVYHLASLARVQPSYLNPHKWISRNINSTTNLLEACRLAGINKIVYASSSTVSYLNEKNGKSPYSVSKSLSEQICRMYQELYGMNVVSLRYFSVYGEKMDMSESNSTVLSRILRSMILDVPFKLYGSGETRRDFTYVGDIINGTLSAMEKIGTYQSDVFELGCTKPIYIKDILKLVPDLCVEHLPAVKEIPITMSYSSDAHYSIGYEYRTDVLAWFEEQLYNLDYWKQRMKLYEN